MASQAHHILVGGGTGFVGRQLVHCLREAGAKVKIITRRLDKGPHYVTWNQIRDDGLPKETTAVVNVAGRNILDPSFWTESYKRDVYDSRIETNRTLVEAIQQSRESLKHLRAFVSISGVGYYKPSDTVEYDESCVQNDSESKNYLMKLARDWEGSSELTDDVNRQIKRIIIRSGVVLGHDGGIIKQLKFPFSMGLGGPLGDGQQWFPWIHVEDLANMFKFAIFEGGQLQQNDIVNGVAPEQVRNVDFVRAFGRALKRPTFIPMPAFVVNKMFGPERAEILLEGQRVKTKAESVGFRFKHPKLQEACEACLNVRTPPTSHPPPPPSHGTSHQKKMK